MRSGYFFQLGIVFLLVVSCQSNKVPASSTGPTSAKSEASFIEQGYKKGTMVDKTGLDGCGFMIMLEDGKTLEPSTLNDSFKKEGLMVWVRYSIPKSLSSICMAGQLVHLTAIEERVANE